MLVLTSVQRDTVLFILFLIATVIMLNCAIRLVRITRWRRNKKKKIEEWAKEHGIDYPRNGNK